MTTGDEPKFLWKPSDKIRVEVSRSLNGYQLTVVAGNPTNQVKNFFQKLANESNFLIFNFDSGWVQFTTVSGESYEEDIGTEMSASDVFQKYLQLRHQYKFSGIGLSWIQYMQPICKDRDLFSWHRYQRPIELISLAKRIPLPTIALINDEQDRQSNAGTIRFASGI